MIELTCTSCRNRLQIDDGFAGGVCRCQYCGTIQTVPGSAGQNRGKAIYKAGPGTGESLDELADVVASSGLGGSRLRKGPTPARRRQVIIAGGVAAVLLLGVVLGAVALMAGGKATPPASFAGVDLQGPRVVFLLDRGTASAEFLAESRDAALTAAANLDTDDAFKILYWTDGGTLTGGGEVLGTGDGWLKPTPGDIELASSRIRDISAVSYSEPWPALQQALAGQPDDLVIATGKGYQLEPDFSRRVLEKIGGNGPRVHVVALGVEPDNDQLRRLAEQTGGTYRYLRDLADGQLVK